MDTEVIRQQIAEFDKQAYDIAEVLSVTTDEDERENLIDEFLVIATATNRLLRMIGADENEMYNL